MKNADKPASPTTGKSKYAGGRFTAKDDESEYSNGDGTIFFPGLSKREYFAAMAMQGIIANHAAVYGNVKDITETSLQYADELLKQLDK